MNVSLLIVLPVVAFAFSFPSADAIVYGHPTGLYLAEYPYSLLVPFFTLVCSALLVALVVHFYRAQWGRRSVITK